MPDAAAMTAQDRLDVMELIARYAQCIDSGDIDGYVDNFLPDATLEYSGGRALGHDEIRAWVGNLMSSGRVGGTPASLRHFVGLPQIQGDGQRCEARTYCVIFTYDSEKRVTTPLVATYADSCVKRDGRWRFEKRSIIGDLSMPRT